MRAIAVILARMVSAGVPAAEPLFETTCIFPTTPKNKPNYRIPAMIQVPDGDLLLFTEKRNDGPGDIGNHDIVVKRSRDKGRTWTAEQVVFDDEDRTCTDITVGLVYERGNKGSTHYWDEIHFARFDLGWLSGEDAASLSVPPGNSAVAADALSNARYRIAVMNRGEVVLRVDAAALEAAAQMARATRVSGGTEQTLFDLLELILVTL